MRRYINYDIHRGVKKIKTKTTLAISGATLGIAGLLMAIALPLGAHAAGGFDANGYNNTARLFNGTLLQWCTAKSISPLSCSAYGFGSNNDRIVMKWNAAWDTCNAGGDCTGAWTNNEWNGNVAGGSGYVWHYKIVWIGSCGADGTTLPDGGYCIWGSYEVLMDQGTFNGTHNFFANATPNGYGAVR